MTCDERRDRMLLYVTDGLEPAERAELAGHLASGCPACAGALAEATAAVAQLPRALPSVTPPASARDRLLSRVAAEESAKKPSPARPMWPRLAIAACIGALVASAFFHIVVRQPFNPARTQDLQYVSLTGGEPQPKAHGRIFWDRDNNDWHVQVFDLKPPPPGRTYELWFITPQKKAVRAGLIDVDERGNGSLVVSVPRDLMKIALAAVTDEPAGGVDQPTPEGHIHVSGKIE